MEKKTKIKWNIAGKLLCGLLFAILQVYFVWLEADLMVEAYKTGEVKCLYTAIIGFIIYIMLFGNEIKLKVSKN